MDNKIVFCVEPGIKTSSGGGYISEELGDKFISTTLPNYHKRKAEILEKVNRHNILPSWNNEKVAVKSGETIELEDKNGIIREMQLESNNTGTDILLEENTLKITANKNSNSGVISYIKIPKNEVGISIVYRKHNYQSLSEFHMESSMSANLNINVIKLGIVKVKKIDEGTGKELANAKLRFEYDGDSKEIITGSNEIASIEDIIGWLKSEVYFCIYEKDYKQNIKLDIPIDEAKIKNRFEIRLKNERAYHAAVDLLANRDEEKTAFSIINRYIRFVDKDDEKIRSEWKTNDQWSYFIGEGRAKLKLTTNPEPYNIQKTLNWLSRQVAPTLKTIKRLDSLNNSTLIEGLIRYARLTDKHKKIIEQNSVNVEDIIYDE